MVDKKPFEEIAIYQTTETNPICILTRTEKQKIKDILNLPTIGECVTLSEIINKHAKNLTDKFNDMTCKAICSEMEISIGVKMNPKKMREWLDLMRHFEDDPNAEEMANYAIVCSLKKAEAEKRQLEAVNAKLRARIDEMENRIIQLEEGTIDPLPKSKHPNDSADAVAYALDYIQKYDKEDL